MLREVSACLAMCSMSLSNWYSLSALAYACICLYYQQEQGTCGQPCKTANICANKCFAALFLSTRLPPCSEALGWCLRLSRLSTHLPKGMTNYWFSLISNMEAQLHAVQNFKPDQGSSTSWLAVQAWSRPCIGGNKSTLFARSMTLSS